MKFLYFQDLHLKGKNSRNRLGNYFEDILLKIDEIISIAKKNKCNAILDGGDLFETDKPSYRVIDAIADRFEKANMNLYSLFGNHSMTAGHIENSNNVGLMHLIKRSKYFHILTELNDRDFKSKDNFSICGIDYYHDIESDLKNKYTFDKISRKGIEKWTVYLIHALITPTKFFDDASHIQCKDIKTNADLVLCSHYHHPFKKVVKNTVFLNIGCSGRDNINEHDILPSVLLLDTEKRDYEIIELKSAKNGKDVFDLSKYEELKANKKDIKEFLNSLKDIDFQSMDLEQQITQIGKEQKIDKEIIDYLLSKLTEIKNELFKIN
jgi:DNA repair exonuclease SbcCD nuclease subunit